LTKDTGRYREAAPGASAAWSGADWNRDRWAWKAAVKRDRRLSKTAVLLAVSLVDDLANSKTAHCRHGLMTMAALLGWSEQTVRRALAALRKAGWIDVEAGRGRGVRSRILFRRGDGTVPFDAAKVIPLSARRAEAAQPKGEEKVQTAPAPRDDTPACWPAWWDDDAPDAQPEGEEKVTELAGYRADKAHEQKGEKVTNRIEKPSKTDRPYKEPKKEPNRAHARDPSAPEAEQPPPVQPAGAATAALAKVPPNGVTYQPWCDWLTRRGLPDLRELDHREGTGPYAPHLMPSRWPPAPNTQAEAEALRFCRWLASRRRERMRQAASGDGASVEAA
jgi:hypothetical protein